jgi:16S rRNA G966 N2-methylase RsmD
LQEDVSKLALSAKRNAEIDMPFALQQIKARQSARTKLPAWYANENLIFPAQISVEQSSSEQTAMYKAALIDKGIAEPAPNYRGQARNDRSNSEILLDLTGGMGVDTAFLSQKFTKTIYVERNADLCETAKHNFSALGLQNIEVENADAADFLAKTEKVDCIFIDPARRDVRGKKVAAFADCEPNILEMLPELLQKAETVLIKTSPMLDISQAIGELRCVAEVHIVAVENECKELLFLLKKDVANEPTLVAVHFPKNKAVQVFSFTLNEERNAECRFAEKPEKYLYEPNAALLKAGAYKLIAKKFNLKKLHPNSHLYTSDVLYCHSDESQNPLFPEIAGQARNDKTDFQGRIFIIEEDNLKTIKQANIAVRNFPETAENLRRKLKINDGGDVYLFATTLFDGRKVLIKCRKV